MKNFERRTLAERRTLIGERIDGCEIVSHSMLILKRPGFLRPTMHGYHVLVLREADGQLRLEIVENEDDATGSLPVYRCLQNPAGTGQPAIIFNATGVSKVELLDPQNGHFTEFKITSDDRDSEIVLGIVTEAKTGRVAPVALSGRLAHKVFEFDPNSSPSTVLKEPRAVTSCRSADFFNSLEADFVALVSSAAGLPQPSPCQGVLNALADYKIGMQADYAAMRGLLAELRLTATRPSANESAADEWVLAKSPVAA